jgi:AcrR family transcriptional regulator
VTFEEIADAAGVSRALVYNYFGDRGGLLAAVYLRNLQRLDDELDLAVTGELTAHDRIRAIVRGYLGFARSNSQAWRAMQLVGTVHHPAVLSARRARMDGFARSWGGGPHARSIAFGVAGMLEAATLDWLDSGGGDDDELAELLFDLVWTGLSSLGSHGVVVPDGPQPVVIRT